MCSITIDIESYGKFDVNQRHTFEFMHTDGDFTHDLEIPGGHPDWMHVVEGLRFMPHGRAFSDASPVAFVEFCNLHPVTEKDVDDKDAEPKKVVTRKERQKAFIKKYRKDHPWL